MEDRQSQFNEEVQRALGRIEGKLEYGFNAVNEQIASFNQTILIHDKRIDGLAVESATLKTKLTAKAATYGAGYGGVIAGIVAIVWEIIKSQVGNNK